MKAPGIELKRVLSNLGEHVDECEGSAARRMFVEILARAKNGEIDAEGERDRDLDSEMIYAEGLGGVDNFL